MLAAGVDPNENFGGGAKLMDDADPVDVFSALPRAPKEGELKVD